VEHEEKEVDKLDEHSDEVGEDIDDARREWESKQDDPTVPGAQPEPGEEEESVPGVAADEDAMSGQRGSDHSPGVPGEEGTGTGNPDAAGADEEDSAAA
jgi:hypothetical protein